MGIDEGLIWLEDGERLFYRFQSGSPGKQPLLLIHGHGEHSGRYLKFFDRLRDLETPIAAFDLRGCGRSSGSPGDINRFEDYLDDVGALLRFLEKKYSVKPPIQLFGHSLGGLIAFSWALKNFGQISKLILSSPLMGLPHEGMVRILTRLLNPVLPHWVIHNPVRAPSLTHDPEEIRSYREDALIRRKITVRLVSQMIRYISLFQSGEVSVPFPVYILMAEKDQIVRPEATMDLYSRISAPAKELEVFPGYYHEIFNETGQDKVFERLRYYLTVGRP